MIPSIQGSRLNAVKSLFKLRGQKLHLSSVVTPQSHTTLEKYQDPVIFPACSENIFIEVSSFYSVCSMSNIKGCACQTMPFHLERTVNSSSILCVFVCVFDLFAIHALTLFRWFEKVRKISRVNVHHLSWYILGTMKLRIAGYEYK